MSSLILSNLSKIMGLSASGNLSKAFLFLNVYMFIEQQTGYYKKKKKTIFFNAQQKSFFSSIYKFCLSRSNLEQRF